MSIRTLATRRPAPALQEPVELPQYLTFRLGRETFALEILHTREIIAYGPLTEVPLMPPFLRGVINLRGQVVPVIDLAVRFGRPPLDIGPRSCIVMVEIPCAGEWHDLGVIVDAVEEVIELAPEQIQAAPAFGTQLRVEFIRGMARLDDRFLIVLAMESVLSLEEMARIADNGERPGLPST